MESIGRENYYIDFNKRAKDAYINGDINYVESVFKELNKDTKKNIVSLALKDGKEEFVFKHKNELNDVQKRYLEAKNILKKEIREKRKFKENMLAEYEDGKFIELEIDMMKVSMSIRNDIVNQIYGRGDINFVQKYLTTITSELKNNILDNEYKKGNVKFVYNNFEKIDDNDIKNKILIKEFELDNFDFLYEKYDIIDNKELKEKIIERAYKDEYVEFLNMHLSDMPKNMKLEAAIKFKKLKISKAELAALLRR